MAGYKSGISGLNNEVSNIDSGTLTRSESSPSGTLVTRSLLPDVLRKNVVVLFEGWNAPWEEEGGKPIPVQIKSTISSIRNEIISKYSMQKISKGSAKSDLLAIQAYATDTDDDVKTLALKFLRENQNANGKIIVYGYSWGGDTAVELVSDFKKKVNLLVTVDAALGPFSRGIARDRVIPDNVVLNVNHYTTTPDSKALSQGIPHKAKDATKTKVVNIKHEGVAHRDMDEITKDTAVRYIVNELIN